MSTEMGPDKPLPYSDHFSSPEEYVESLLNFLGSNSLLGTLCGGVHILDFFTTDPPLYPRLLPQEWRQWFDATDIMDILDLLMREDMESIPQEGQWRNGPIPPNSLLQYITSVRLHLLNRSPSSSRCSLNRSLKSRPLARHVAVGMSLKKVHEVGLFAHYLDNLCQTYQTSTSQQISHLVDFGSGQNYLGRALASQPFNKNIVAIESKSENAERAREFDVMAKLAVKEKILRNKKVWRETGEHVPPTPPPEITPSASPPPTVEVPPPEGGTGTILYINHRLADGNLSDVISQIPPPSSTDPQDQNLLVTSLHSCGNLLHHGLRSLTLNPTVQIVAMVGCCYNLLTERLGPATYKLPSLRPAAHPRLSTLAEARDPNGFPMSERFCTAYPSPSSSNPHASSNPTEAEGVKLNITSRMMAVQAPGNWGPHDSESFFTRHFYRALLQRIFLDYGIITPPRGIVEEGASPAGHSSGGTPIIIGSLRKSCYVNFPAYVRGALAKLMLEKEGEKGNVFREKLAGIEDEEILRYERIYEGGKKDLSVIWALMAFSAGVVEAAIVVDRWCWLMEQEEVGEAWVESVFEYGVSPRNLVVVGVKK
ncbi:uncharacterized protein RCC_07571 [Ramularia collo-cygni]|uniref:Methyltransferase domain-containing protein n=1 Tax=Ramularia collo-cygni TaxID=112498 RepID=A0A2D3VD49_9PEZI|nr:uncharacterized protein RCC_07571 [Ramularia collo-cygni]CZT21706.1 uncharacterized protein RCC_07571 [Ramularia collo-cygni]